MPEDGPDTSQLSHKRQGWGVCPLCQRETALTFHHLIPRTLHSNKWFRKRFSREQMHGGINICRLCHSGLHRYYDEKTLGRRYHSLAQINADPALQKYFAWVAKQKC